MPPDTNISPPPVAVTTSTSDPKLELDDIQGDILLGLQKKAEEFVFFSIKTTDDFKCRARLLLKFITTTRQVQQAQMLVDVNKKVGGPLLPIRGLNVGFTATGIEKLTGATTNMDASFVAGAVAKAVGPGGLNDPVDASGKLPKWLPPFTAGAIDGVLLVTGETDMAAKAHADTMLADLGPSISVVYREMGKVRPDREDGHEHFGYSDGISQPGVRGLTKPEHPLNDPDQGLPGQDLPVAGHLRFGYPAQVSTDDQTAGPPPDMAFPWMRNGSYMVFRRLEQLVPEFHKFSHDQGVSKGMDPTLLEARMVGRWKSGAPLELTPLQDDQTLGADKNNNNDFVYSTDPAQRLCPYAAHIRKVYPRDDLGGEGPIQIRRIMRAGIAFGPELDDEENKTETTKQSRGLMFVCYQTSIINQFEFVQKSWANNPGFVFGKTRPDSGAQVIPGFDPIIGQAGGDRARKMDEPIPNFPTGNTRSELDTPKDFVVPTGGGYFFSPSIQALQTKLLA